MIEAQKGHRERAEEEKVPKGTEITQGKVEDKSSSIASLFAAKLENGEILIFDKELNILKRIQSLFRVDYYGSSDLVWSGNMLITCGCAGIEYWEITPTSCKRTSRNTHIGDIYTLTLLPNNSIAAAGCSPNPCEMTIYIIDSCGTISHSHSVPEEDTRILSLLWVEGTGSLWIGDDNGNIYIWEGPDPVTRGRDIFCTLEQEVHTFGSWVTALEDVRYSRTVCSGGNDGVGIWGYLGDFLYHMHFGYPVTSLSQSGGGNIIIGDCRGFVHLCRGYRGYIHLCTSTHSPILSFQPHQEGFWGRGIQRVWDSHSHSESDSEFYITGSMDMKIKLICLKVKGEVLKEMNVGDRVYGMTAIYMKEEEEEQSIYYFYLRISSSLYYKKII